MAMSDALNIAVVGAGRMGCTHLRALAGAESIRVAAVDRPVDRRALPRRVARPRRPHARRPRRSRRRRRHRGRADRGAVHSAPRPGRRLCRASGSRSCARSPAAPTTAEIGSRRRRLSRRRSAAAGRVLEPVRAPSWSSFGGGSSRARSARSRSSRAGSGTPSPRAPSCGVRAAGSRSTWASTSSTRSAG